MQRIYREKVRYEDLLLIWLDRINQKMQKEFHERNSSYFLAKTMELIDSVLALYNLLPRELREEIDREAGKPIEELLQYSVKFGYLEGELITLHSLKSKDGLEFHKLIHRARQIIRIIVDVLHRHGLLLREDVFFEGIEDEDQA